VFPSIVYARSRQAIRKSVDRLLLTELRERAAIQATEAERARMAREIHDDPLQAIAGVIQKLADPVPDTESARDSLRDVAARLRGVATELHPPILDDLGLVPALEALARGASEQLPIEVRIADETGYADRPPGEVELASYRIVQEAVSNAIKHANASCIAVEGRVSATAVALTVSDDGIGFSAADADEALLQGHLGVSSMRQRAAAIGARVALGKAAAGGTAVTMRWPA
jgi:signal transduction histidine kinase